MKSLTLIQPWATLIALGKKKIETRGWKTSYRGPLLIHAGKKIYKTVLDKYPFKEVLEAHGIKELPTGVIIAKCNLIDCVEIESPPEGIEYYFGDYTPGRYAWLLGDVEMLKEPVPAKGQLSLWEFDLKNDNYMSEMLKKYGRNKFKEE